MALWTDIIDPADLTGYVREELDAFETKQGTLAQWLPNQKINDVEFRWEANVAGQLTEAAQWRAFDAEGNVGAGLPTRRVTTELGALSENHPVTEFQQLRDRNNADAQMQQAIAKAAARATYAVSNAVEVLRGSVLTTGRLTIAQSNYQIDEDFRRPAEHNVTAATLWSDSTADRLTELTDWSDVYLANNGETPGCLLMTQHVFRQFAKGDQFKTQLLGGAFRTGSMGEINSYLQVQGLPPIVIFNRMAKVNGVKQTVLSNDHVLMLPAPVGVDAYADTELGTTVWGPTLSSSEADFSIDQSDQAGLLAAAYTADKPPFIREVIAEALVLPVLTNAQLSLAAKVL